MKTSYRKRIKAGVRCLSHKEPLWFLRVNLDTLNLRHCSLCILGQLTGRYHSAASYEICNDGPDRFSRGFTIYGNLKAWDKLTAEWRSAILALRADYQVINETKES